MAASSEYFRVEQVKDITIVRLVTDAIDSLNLEDVLHDLREIVVHQKPLKLLLNVAQVQYFHSIALGKLVRLNALLNKQGGELRLCCLQPTVYQVLVATRLDQIFETHSSEEAAVAAWAGAETEPNQTGAITEQP